MKYEIIIVDVNTVHGDENSLLPLPHSCAILKGAIITVIVDKIVIASD
jgi:hypothetical protein